MADQSAPSVAAPQQVGLGYVVDQSHPPLFFAAVLGVGDVIEHSLSRLERFGHDVSPIVIESRSRTVVINDYEPDAVTVQVVQYDGTLERVTEILGAGIGLSVLREVRRVSQILDLDLRPLSDHFCRRMLNEKMTFVQTYALFRGDPTSKKARLAQVFRGLQDKCRREATLLRDLL